MTISQVTIFNRWWYWYI